jgi:hypothetical protein
MYLVLYIRRWSRRSRLRLDLPWMQTIPVFISAIDFPEAEGTLDKELSAAEIIVLSGRHSVYIHRRRDIAALNPDISRCYPGAIGLKLIKGRQMAPDGTPFYTSEAIAPASTRWSMKAIGSISEKKAVSNLLNTEGVAPRIFDIIRLESANGAFHYAFVTQHVSGTVVQGDKGSQFINRFKSVLKKLGMETVSIKEHCDLRPPEFRGNIIGDGTGTWYVDIQNFVIADGTVVRSIADKARRSLLDAYNVSNQRAPKNEEQVANFWLPFHQSFDFLRLHGVVVEKAIIIDERCSAPAFFVPVAVAGGALWHIVEKPIQKEVKQWLYLVGCTRFSDGKKREESEAFCEQHPRCGVRLFLLDDGHVHSIKHRTDYVDFYVIERRGTEAKALAGDIPGHWRFLGNSHFSSASGVAFIWDLFALEPAERVTTRESIGSFS